MPIRIPQEKVPRGYRKVTSVHASHGYGGHKTRFYGDLPVSAVEAGFDAAVWERVKETATAVFRKRVGFIHDNGTCVMLLLIIGGLTVLFSYGSGVGVLVGGFFGVIFGSQLVVGFIGGAMLDKYESESQKKLYKLSTRSHVFLSRMGWLEPPDDAPAYRKARFTTYPVPCIIFAVPDTAEGNQDSQRASGAASDGDDHGAPQEIYPQVAGDDHDAPQELAGVHSQAASDRDDHDAPQDLAGVHSQAASDGDDHDAPQDLAGIHAQV